MGHATTTEPDGGGIDLIDGRVGYRAPMELHNPDRLLKRLESSARLVFLLGAPITAPAVPDVRGMIALARQRLVAPPGASAQARRESRRVLKELDAMLREAGADLGAQYRAMFEWIGSTQGPNAANELVIDAVLQARCSPPSSRDPDRLARMERDTAGWKLPSAVWALGWLAARHPQRIRAVLTTNFDPLIEVAIAEAGGRPAPCALIRDDALATTDGLTVPVVHLHGQWRGDTLHTPAGLVDRPRLAAALEHLCDGATLVVMAYGGWRDVVAETLANMKRAVRPDVLWCFYEGDWPTIEQRYPEVCAALNGLRHRAFCYGHVDCHALLPVLRQRLDQEGEIFGRRKLLERLETAMLGKESVELIGEPQMGRSALLDWLARWAEAEGICAAQIDARRLRAPTPAALVQALADKLGSEAGRRARLLMDGRAVPGPADAIAALPVLNGACVLIDDADVLAGPGTGFTRDFFDAVRARMQAGQLRWVSVARERLSLTAGFRTLNSQFLSDAKHIVVGGYDLIELKMGLPPRLGRLTNAVLEAAGTLPRLVGHLLDHAETNPRAALDDLAEWAEPLFDRWWQHPAAEQTLLKQATGSGYASADADRKVQVVGQRLVDRGLLVTRDAHWVCNGAVWEAYVTAR